MKEMEKIGMDDLIVWETKIGEGQGKKQERQSASFSSLIL